MNLKIRNIFHLSIHLSLDVPESKACTSNQLRIVPKNSDSNCGPNREGPKRQVPQTVTQNITVHIHIHVTLKMKGNLDHEDDHVTSDMQCRELAQNLTAILMKLLSVPTVLHRNCRNFCRNISTHKIRAMRFICKPNNQSSAV